MHRWDDEDVDWGGIDSAANYIGDYCYRYGRLGGSTKEKYGTVRYYVHFTQLSLHNLIYPKHHYIQFPKWLIYLDNKVVEPILSPLNTLWNKWQLFIYRKSYEGAVKRWPHLRKEILCCADYPEYLKGV